MGFLGDIFKTVVDTGKSAIKDEVRSKTRSAIDNTIDNAANSIAENFKKNNTQPEVKTENEQSTMANFMENATKIAQMTGKMSPEQAAEMQKAQELLNNPDEMNKITNAINEIYGVSDRSTTTDPTEAFRNMMAATSRIGSETDSEKGKEINEKLKAQGIDPSALNSMLSQNQKESTDMAVKSAEMLQEMQKGE